MTGRINKLALMTTFCLSFFVGNACAEPRMSQFAKMKTVESFKFYLEGVGSGFSWYNVFIVQKGGEPIFCEPENMSLNHLNYINLIEHYSKTFPKLSSDDMPVNMILLYALVEAFPCKK